jgi:Skp family chaperone for outer membrane proteins
MKIFLKKLKKIFLFIKKYWFIILTVLGIIFFLLIKIFSDFHTKGEIELKVEEIKKENDDVIKHINEEIEKIDKEVEEIKKEHKKSLKNKKDRDKEADDIFNIGG